MADDLGDEWWVSDDNKTQSSAEELVTSQKKTDGELVSISKKPSKRKAEAADATKKEKHAKKKKQSKSGQDQRKERKRITEESEENLSKPGSAEDVRTMMSKVLKDRLGKEALEDCLPAEDDFYPDNVASLVPSKYLNNVLTNWRAILKKSLFMKKTGSPCILIVTSSAIRAVELNRLIKDFLDGKCKVAKLFAKHMKVEEQKKFLTKTNCQVGIGTPGRLLLLIKQGVLQLESLVAVVLDWNWRDSKLKRLPDIPEVRQDLVLLLKDFLIETVRGSPCKLALL
ncbi:protein CMSS1 [Elysia marginata]|uniref:Protein CMSS1 n=1 Tax=Elysia marginata TaxID=1093978 RepID=A0AAV4GQS2_9GAST|nr:protein CMSS1 [Elysia marginata]